jgi:hypothetical protein
LVAGGPGRWKGMGKGVGAWDGWGRIEVTGRRPESLELISLTLPGRNFYGLGPG